MDKNVAKEKGPYREKLTTNVKQRYLDKLADIKNVDSYELPAAEWNRDLDSLPPCTYMEIANYLVFGISYNEKTVTNGFYGFHDNRVRHWSRFFTQQCFPGILK